MVLIFIYMKKGGSRLFHVITVFVHCFFLSLVEKYFELLCLSVNYQENHVAESFHPER